MVVAGVVAVRVQSLWSTKEVVINAFVRSWVKRNLPCGSIPGRMGFVPEVTALDAIVPAVTEAVAFALKIPD